MTPAKTTRFRHGPSPVIPNFQCLLAAALLVLPASAARAGSAAITWQEQAEIASGQSPRGPWQRHHPLPATLEQPTLAVDGQGEIALAWVDRSKRDIFFQRLSSGGVRKLAHPVNVSRSPATFSRLPRLIVAPGSPRQVFLLWQEMPAAGEAAAGEIFFAQSKDGGATFSRPLNLSGSPADDGAERIGAGLRHGGSLDLAYFGADGALYAAWSAHDGALWFCRSQDAGESFSRAHAIATHVSAGPARAPTLAVAPDGTIYLGWSEQGAAGGHIRVAKSTDGGRTFSPPRIVAPSPAYADTPQLAVTADGVLHLVYAAGAGASAAPQRIFYTRSRDGGVGFEAPREISAPPPEGGERAAGFPSIAGDGRGRLCVAWEESPADQALPGSLTLAVSLDGGRSFSPPARVPDSGSSSFALDDEQRISPPRRLAINGAGLVAVVAGGRQADAAASGIRLIRGTLAGAPPQRRGTR